MAEKILEMRHITKDFSGVKALDDVNLVVERGEIHALCGENGAGKSTLMNVLSGVYPYGTYSGDVVYKGETCQFHDIRESERKGIVIIHQELALIPLLTIAENIFIGNENLKLGHVIDWDTTQRKAAEVLDSIGMHENVNRLVGDLGMGQQQMIEICKALMVDAKVIIMDEPTASLTRTEVNQLLRTVHYLKSKNISVVFVSHRLDEVLEISDTVTVIRDGTKVGSYSAKEMTPKRLAELMTGIAIEYAFKPARKSDSRVILEVDGLSRKDQYENISFKLYQGEVLGLCGLLGSGRTELALSLFGITKQDAGKIYLDSIPVNFKSHRDAIRAGIGYVSEDRLTLGLVLQQSVSDNAVLSILDKLKNRIHFIDDYKKMKIVHQWIQDLDIKVSNTENPISTLSGGNQQKIVLAKWILTQPKVLILDAPTVGVDIAAKSSIYQLIHKLAEQGISILLISDEIPEVYYNCDRILHIEHGQIMNEYEPSKISESFLEGVVNG